jgi:GABA(A) receptor-associated protein
MPPVPFRKRFSFEDRCIESVKIKDKFPGRLPIIVERSDRSVNIQKLDKEKFLVPSDLNLSQFIFVVRRRLELPSETALFLFVGGILPTTGMLIRELYALHKDPDGFLYVQYSGENTFGSQEFLSISSFNFR